MQHTWKDLLNFPLELCSAKLLSVQVTGLLLTCLK